MTFWKGSRNLGKFCLPKTRPNVPPLIIGRCLFLSPNVRFGYAKKKHSVSKSKHKKLEKQVRWGYWKSEILKILDSDNSEVFLHLGLSKSKLFLFKLLALRQNIRRLNNPLRKLCFKFKCQSIIKLSTQCCEILWKKNRFQERKFSALFEQALHYKLPGKKLEK